MNRNLEAIAIAAARECNRQGVSEDALIRLLQAHEYAVRHHDRLPTAADVREVAYLIEPTINANGYRQRPVSFANLLTTATEWPYIPETVDRIMGHSDWATDPAALTKALLDCHPFLDGNGRMAWVIYNWHARQLGDPLALPEFYGTVA